MGVLMLSIGVLLVIALVSGWVKSDEVTFGLEFNTLKSPFLSLGCSLRDLRLKMILLKMRWL